MEVGPIPSRKSTTFTSLTPMVTTLPISFGGCGFNGVDVPLMSELKATAEVRQLDTKLDQKKNDAHKWCRPSSHIHVTT